MIPQAGGFQGCYLDTHRNNWRCVRAVRALCKNAPSELELDSSTMGTLGTSVIFIRSTGEPALAQVVGYSQHGDAYSSSLCFDFDNLCTPTLRFVISLFPPTISMYMYGGSWAGRWEGGRGGGHLPTVPRVFWGGRLPWGGAKGGRSALVKALHVLTWGCVRKEWVIYFVGMRWVTVTNCVVCALSRCEGPINGTKFGRGHGTACGSRERHGSDGPKA